MESNSSSVKFRTEYELLLEELEKEGRVKILTEEASNQIFREIYGPDQNGKTLGDFNRENSLNMALSGLELRDILLAA